MWRRIAYVVIGIAAIAAIIAIARMFYPVDRTVTINYVRFAQCNGWQAGNVITSAGDGAFVFFKINSIVNEAKNATDFFFVPEQLYVAGTQPKAYTNASVQPLQLFIAPELTVPRGETKIVNGYAVAIVSIGDVPDPSALAAQKDFHLLTDQSAKPGQTIIFSKSGSGPPWGQQNSDCQAIRFALSP